jgi:hypothetical protein
MVAVDCPLRTGSTVGFQAMIVPSSRSKMKVAGAVVARTVIGKVGVGFHTIPVGAAAGGGDRPGGSGIVTVNPIRHRAPMRSLSTLAPEMPSVSTATTGLLAFANRRAKKSGQR